jgi:hypothetical protein
MQNQICEYSMKVLKPIGIISNIFGSKYIFKVIKNPPKKIYVVAAKYA